MSAAQTFGTPERQLAHTLITLALLEDLGDRGDLTCQALLSERDLGTVQVVSRQTGILSGMPVAAMVFAQLDAAVRWQPRLEDGATLAPGTVVADVSGPLPSLLIGERTMLNFLTHLSGIASLTRRFVDAIAGTNAVVLDTRKTHPGYRRLEKYAVRCGGGVNHRLGLYDGVLIKDNHLAAWAKKGTIASAVETARMASPPGISLEVEVDTLDQLRDALGGAPDLVLLDNMPLADLRTAVSIRNAVAPAVRLEASGGVTLATIRAIAETGVDRISIGALTHSAPALDLGFDWPTPSASAPIDSLGRVV